MNECVHRWTVTSECPFCLRAEIERLRGLLREYIENDLTDEWEYDFLKRIREAVGNE
jgi:hypothetical protein